MQPLSQQKHVGLDCSCNCLKHPLRTWDCQWNLLSISGLSTIPLTTSSRSCISSLVIANDLMCGEVVFAYILWRNTWRENRRNTHTIQSLKPVNVGHWLFYYRLDEPALPTNPNEHLFTPRLLQTYLALEWHGPLVGKTGPWASPLPAGWSVGLAGPYGVLLDQLSHGGRLFQLSAMLRGGHWTWQTHKHKKPLNKQKWPIQQKSMFHSFLSR